MARKGTVGHKAPAALRQSGQALLMALIFMMVGSLIISALLPFMGNGYKNTLQVYNRKARQLYAADAGVRDALWIIKNRTETLPSVGNTMARTVGGLVNSQVVSYQITRLPDSKYNAVTYEVISQAIDSFDHSSVTSITSEVSILDFSDKIMKKVITSPGTVTSTQTSNLIDIYGEIWCPNQIAPDFGGNVTLDQSPIVGWPIIASSNRIVQNYYYDQVKDLSPYSPADGVIDLSTVTGPLYVDKRGNLPSSDNYTITGTGTLTGSIYINGNLTFDNRATVTLGTAGIEGFTIFVTGNVTGVQPQSSIGGPGAIIAIGDIKYLPNPGLNQEYVLVMSLGGTVLFQPNNVFYGSIAGNVEVRFQPQGSGDNSIRYVLPTTPIDVPGSGGAVIGSIRNWDVGAAKLGLSLSSAMPTAYLGVEYSAPIGVVGGIPPYQFTTTSGVDKGLSVNVAEGRIVGTPDEEGVAAFEVSVTDNVGMTCTAVVSVSVVKWRLAVLGPAYIAKNSTYEFSVRALDDDGCLIDNCDAEVSVDFGGPAGASIPSQHLTLDAGICQSSVFLGTRGECVLTASAANAIQGAKSVFVQEQVTCNASADTYIDQSSKRTAYGGLAYAWVAHSTTPDRDKYGLIKFDIPALPSGVTIDSALVKLYVFFGPGNTVTARRSLASWVESVTWETQPPYDGSNANPPSELRSGWGELNVTADVRAFFDPSSPQPNYGWILTGLSVGEPGVEFYTRESNDKPRLVITYH